MGGDLWAMGLVILAGYVSVEVTMEKEENKRFLEHAEQELEKIQKQLVKVLADIERLQHEIHHALEQQKRDDEV